MIQLQCSQSRGSKWSLSSTHLAAELFQTPQFHKSVKEKPSPPSKPTAACMRRTNWSTFHQNTVFWKQRKQLGKICFPDLQATDRSRKTTSLKQPLDRNRNRWEMLLGSEEHHPPISSGTWDQHAFNQRVPEINWRWERDRCVAEAAVLRIDRFCSSCKCIVSKLNTNKRWLKIIAVMLCRALSRMLTKWIPSFLL